MCGIVPVDGESAEYETGPVDKDGVEFWRAWMRWLAFSSPMYLTPKLSKTREKVMGLVACFQSAEVLGIGAKPKLAR